MTLMTLTTSTADIALTLSPNANGGVTVDIPLAAVNDFKTISGPARLGQDVSIWVLRPMGAYVFDPTTGNPLIGQLLQPSSNDPNTYLAMIQAAEGAFIAHQQQDAAAGWLSADEMVDHIDASVLLGDGGANGPIGAVNEYFTIHTRAGTPVQGFAPFSALTG